ncbi:MAG: hypothetical protein CMQ16_07025 [Gammaproteobacteria bacterium]|nr:hypothetical protein [Gammaproteobacteria bacterium]
MHALLVSIGRTAYSFPAVEAIHSRPVGEETCGTYSLLPLQVSRKGTPAYMRDGGKQQQGLVIKTQS